nr:signal peptidase I [uncultured Acetatifactor sp.]
MKRQKKESGKQKAGKRRSILAGICNLVSVLSLLAVVAVCIPMTVPGLLGYDAYTVISGSMEPAIPTGSAIYVETVPPEQVAVGDVIAFYSRGAVITHRVAENLVVTGEFITKGDANAENDVTPAAYESLMGRVAFSIPFLGNVMAVCSGTAGKVYLACGVVGAVLLQLAGSLFRADRDEKDR